MANKFKVTFHRAYEIKHADLANEMYDFFGIDELPEDDGEMEKFAELAAREHLDEDIFMNNITASDFDVDIHTIEEELDQSNSEGIWEE